MKFSLTHTTFVYHRVSLYHWLLNDWSSTVTFSLQPFVTVFIKSYVHLFPIDYLRGLAGHKLQMLSQPSGRSPSPRNYVWLCDGIYPNCSERTVHTTRTLLASETAGVHEDSLRKKG
jgi:hypothetical protein